jgi:hypothetical protein
VIPHLRAFGRFLSGSRDLGTGAHKCSRLGSNRALANPAGLRQPPRRPGRCTHLAQASVPESRQLVRSLFRAP